MAFCVLPDALDFEKLQQEDFDHIQSQNSFAGKMLTMTKLLQLSDKEKSDRKRIVSRISNILQPYYPDCEVLIFGSTVNGYGFRGCDLDLLFLPFPEYCNLDIKSKGSNTIPAPYRILSGQCPRTELLLLKEIHHLKFIRRIFYTQKYFFKKIIFIPAKCPILNLEFVDYPITCDFSASNRLVVNNTELLWLYGKLDDRVKPLIVVLRYWAKSLGFISKTLLSSYAFTLMVIFFLQNTEPPILPSVKTLNEKAGYSRIIDDWETAICFDTNRISDFKNSSSLEQLVVQFCEFYWNFDFIQNVVSPYHGRPISVKELTESKNERIRKFKITPFSIQDPFVLSRNISRDASIKTSFKLALLIAKNLVLQKKFTFQSLFDYSYYQKEMAAMFKPTRDSFEKLVCFPLYLNYELFCKLGCQLNSWYRRVCETVYDVLQYGLLIESEVIDSVYWNIESPAKKKRKILQNNLQPIASIQCALNPMVLWGRKKVKDADFKGEEDDIELPSCLRRQFKISKLLNRHEASSSANLHWFTCQCYKYTASEIPDIIIIISPINDVVEFSEKKCAVRSFIEKHVIRILMEE